MADSGDSFSVVSHQSWFGRLGGAISGIAFGVILFIVAFPVLWLNEGRAVKTHQALVEGAAAVVHVEADKADPANQGKLVHVTGQTHMSSAITDPELSVTAPALRLQRKAEMYQWKQREESKTEKTLGGGSETVTTYTYSKVWSDDVINSGSFKKPAGHENPGSMPIASHIADHTSATVGAFTLPVGMVQGLSNFVPLTVNDQDLTKAQKALGSTLRLDAGGFYLPRAAASASATTTPDAGGPQIGDVRLKFSVVEPGAVSLIARQNNATFEPWSARNGRTISLISHGTLTAEAMFQQEVRNNTIFTWVLRFVGAFVMFLGISMVLKPLSVLADVIPLFGDLVEMGTKLIALTIALPLSLTTIAMAWVFYRPLLGILMLAVAAAIGFFCYQKLQSRRTIHSDTAPPLPG
jgi:hypothetical protein